MKKRIISATLFAIGFITYSSIVHAICPQLKNYQEIVQAIQNKIKSSQETIGLYTQMISNGGLDVYAKKEYMHSRDVERDAIGIMEQELQRAKDRVNQCLSAS